MEFSFSNRIEEIPKTEQGVDRLYRTLTILSDNLGYRAEAANYFDRMLKYMMQTEASDLDFGGIGAGEQAWLRIHGRKSPCRKLGNVSHDVASALICLILSDTEVDTVMTSHSVDFSYTLILGDETIRFRASAYMDFDYLAVNFRKINPTLITIDALGFPPPIIRKFDLDFEKKGLILVTGVTGSGKSTTLDAIINMNNRKNEGHITIIGKPIEYFHKSEKCIVRHREVGRDTLSFKNGTIESLRQDPDIIVIGEMRDPETIITALEITDSGHKVFSTLHTGSAIESIHRIVAECPAVEQSRVRLRLADVLSVVVCQKLVPTLDGKRVMAKEILNVTSNVAAAIISNNVPEIYQMITEGKEHGMITLEQDLMRLFINKIISKKEAIAYANNKKRMIDLLNYYQNKGS